MGNKEVVETTKEKPLTELALELIINLGFNAHVWNCKKCLKRLREMLICFLESEETDKV